MLETLREEKEKSEADLKDELKQTQEAVSIVAISLIVNLVCF